MDFRPEAPVVIRVGGRMKADRTRVWSELTAVERWPRWNRRIAFASLRGDLSEGAALQWACDGMKFASVVTEVAPPTRIGWTVRTLGARGYLRWTLTEVSSQVTRVELEESWEGLLVRLLGGTLRRTLEPSRSEWLRALASRVEREDGPVA